jgi:hypothetical protein
VWEAIWYWILWRRFTLLSLCLCHVELWLAHVPARLSYFCCSTHFVRQYLTWGDISRNVCYNRNMRGVPALEPTRAPCEITWRKQSDRSVNLHHRIQCQIATHKPTARVTSHELTWCEDSESPLYGTCRICVNTRWEFFSWWFVLKIRGVPYNGIQS